MKKNEGLTVINLIIVILVAIILMTFAASRFAANIGQTIEIAYKVITKQIDINEEISTNEIIMGITDVTGEGIIINILDGNDMIHQEDVIILLDELKNSGSQAISVNDIRITNSTYLYCDGSVLLIDGEKIGNPFTIKAIGNSETIFGAITRNKGYVSTLQRDGIEINIEKSDNVQIPKTRKKDLVEYAKNKTSIGMLKKSNEYIGKANVRGKGIEIIIQENKSKLTALSFLQLVNDLNSAGVKAISINGERITSMTDMMDISNTYVLINSIAIKAPFVIDVVGDQDKILEVLDYANSYISKIKSKGNEVDIYKASNLKIERYVQKKDKNKMAIEYLK